MSMTEGKRRRNKERKAALRQQRPPWLTNTQRMFMNHIGIWSPPGFSVDHIVPLRGITVSGLDVPWNLRVVPIKDNSRKGNSWPSDRLWNIDELRELFGFRMKYLRIGAPSGCFAARRK